MACCAIVILVSVTIITIKPLLNASVWRSLRCHCRQIGRLRVLNKSLVQGCEVKGLSCDSRRAHEHRCTGGREADWWLEKAFICGVSLAHGPFPENYSQVSLSRMDPGSLVCIVSLGSCSHS